MTMYYQLASNQEQSIINYQQWRMAWYSFLELLDIDYKDGYRCSICGDFPNIVSCDATTLAFKREYVRTLNVSNDTANNNYMNGR